MTKEQLIRGNEINAEIGKVGQQIGWVESTFTDWEKENSTPYIYINRHNQSGALKLYGDDADKVISLVMDILQAKKDALMDELAKV